MSDYNSSTKSQGGQAMAEDTFPINGIDYLKFYVGNSKQAAYFYQNAFGFDIIGYSGLETGEKTETSYLCQQNEIKFIFSSPVKPGHFYESALAKHGDGVQDIALTVDDAEEAFKLATERGARPYKEPYEITDENGTIKISGVYTYGDTVHSFIERTNYRGEFLPKFKKINQTGKPIGIEFVDHIVGNVELGKMNEFVKFYENVFGFTQIISFDDKDISTEYTALMSKVMANGNGRIKFPINEPAEGRKKSQIDEYLEFYGGSGVQHIALHTSDIIKTIDEMKARGIEFLYVPSTYYDDLTARVGKIDESIDELAKRGILVDRDDEGYLLQLFTKPIGNRPTLFFEIIERKGAKSFGKGNFKALFEAIEREQELRGTL